MFESTYYLCISDKHKMENRYKCYPFESFEKADKYFKNKYGNWDKVSTFMCDINFFVPQMLHQKMLTGYINSRHKILCTIEKQNSDIINV